MTNATTISIDTLTAKGREALEAERKQAERKAAAKAAITAYIDGKAALDILKNPVVAYTYEDETYTAYANAVDMLDNTEKKHTMPNGKVITDRGLFNAHLKRLVDYVAADAMRDIGAKAPRLARNDGLKHIAAMATLLGYTAYKADNRDFDYIGIGMKKLNRDGDITISAAKRVICTLFRAKLNNINVRVLINGGKVEFNEEYVKAQADAEKAAIADAKKAAAEKAAKTAEKAKEKELNAKRDAKAAAKANAAA